MEERKREKLMKREERRSETRGLNNANTVSEVAGGGEKDELERGEEKRKEMERWEEM